MSAPARVKELGGCVGLKTVAQFARLAGEPVNTMYDMYKSKPDRFDLILEGVIARIKNLDEWQEGKPDNSDLKVVKIHGCNGKFHRCLGFYERQWNKWYMQDGTTEINALAYANLIEA